MNQRIKDIIHYDSDIWVIVGDSITLSVKQK